MAEEKPASRCRLCLAGLLPVLDLVALIVIYFATAGPRALCMTEESWGWSADGALVLSIARFTYLGCLLVASAASGGQDAGEGSSSRRNSLRDLTPDNQSLRVISTELLGDGSENPLERESWRCCTCVVCLRRTEQFLRSSFPYISYLFLAVLGLGRVMQDPPEAPSPAAINRVLQDRGFWMSSSLSLFLIWCEHKNSVALLAPALRRGSRIIFGLSRTPSLRNSSGNGPVEGGASVELLPSDQYGSSSASHGANDEERGTADAEEKEKKEEKDVDKKVTVKRLLQLVSADWPLIIQACVFLVSAAIFDVLQPKYTSDAVAALIKGEEQGTLKQKPFEHPLVMLALSAVACGICSSCRGATFILIGTRAAVRLRQKLFDTLLVQDTAFFDTTKTGELTSRMTQDCQKMTDQVTLNCNVFMRTTISMVTTLIFMLYLSPPLTFCAFVSVPCVCVIAKKYGNFMRSLSKKTQEALAEANHVAEESLSTMTTVRSFAAGKLESERFGKKMGVFKKLQNKYALMYLPYLSSNQILPQFATCIVLFYGGKLAMHGEIETNHILAFVLYLQRLNDAFATLADFYSNMVQALGAATRVFELMDREPEYPLEVANPVMTTSYHGDLTFKDVCFTYPSRPNVQVLTGLSVHIPSGNVVALVGPSGNGKSTVIGLLKRLYPPASGQVLLDGVDVLQYDNSSYHRVVSIVGQEPVLYARSIKENILYGLVNPGMPSTETLPSDEEIHEVCRTANAHNFIMDMPKGYDTDVGERGVQLSGGQKQRIAIARALIRNPKVLLLDEATSALDAESEKQVQQAIDRMIATGSMTVVIVAHRLSTVKSANKICVVKGGKIVESGSHQELLEKRGIYYSLVESQLSHAVDEAKVHDASMGG